MRLVVLVSGSGTNLQAVIDGLHLGDAPVEIVAVGADRPCEGLRRAEAAGIGTFLVAPSEHPDRERWNRALEREIVSHRPDRVVFAGFMRIVDAPFVAAFPGRIVNTHPSLLPSFPGAHAVRDALAYGVKVTGCSIIAVDAGVDTGPILAQRACAVETDDTEQTLHERIKVLERDLLIETVAALADARG